MAWNEPGGGNRDPWNPNGRRGGGDGGGMPDVDQLLQRLKSRFRGKGPRPGGLSSGGVGLLAAAALVAWLLLCFFTVDAQERAVVLRFGEPVRSYGPGWAWRAWPIETVEKVNFTQVRQVTERSEMLTKDENIVNVEVKVQYKIRDVDAYLFGPADPDAALRDLTKASVRQVLGASALADLLKDPQTPSQAAEKILQKRLDAYASGLEVAELSLQKIEAPDAVQDAFADARKADEEAQRLRSEAEAYANDRLPKARGNAARELADAAAYRDRLIARAQGEADRFLKLLAEYRKAPRVTRDRLYLETMSEVLSSATKVVVDAQRNGPVIYLPLDASGKAGANSGGAGEAPAGAAGTHPGTPGSGDFRSRDRGGH